MKDTYALILFDSVVDVHLGVAVIRVFLANM
jgi:hypothetical protein